MAESANRIVVFAGSARVYDPAEPDCHLPVVADRLSRPEVAIERDNRIAFARLVRELALDVEEPPEPSRIPQLVGSVTRN